MMPAIRNEEYWLEVEGKSPFTSDDPRVWEALEKIQKEGRMRQLDILLLSRLIDEVYRCGVAAGKEG